MLRFNDEILGSDERIRWARLFLCPIRFLLCKKTQFDIINNDFIRFIFVKVDFSTYKRINKWKIFYLALFWFYFQKEGLSNPVLRKVWWHFSPNETYDISKFSLGDRLTSEYTWNLEIRKMLSNLILFMSFLFPSISHNWTHCYARQLVKKIQFELGWSKNTHRYCCEKCLTE